MQKDQDLKFEQLRPIFQKITEQVQLTVQSCQGDELALLALLRLLENLHREIREGPFQEALPSNRQALYSLLRNIEAEGGWPSIPRMKLQTLFSKLNQETENEGCSETTP